MENISQPTRLYKDTGTRPELESESWASSVEIWQQYSIIGRISILPESLAEGLINEFPLQIWCERVPIAVTGKVPQR